MALIEVQILNRVLDTKDYSLLTKNNIGLEHFPNFSQEYTFISEHYKQYKTVPDRESVIQHFPTFSIITVTEPDKYLVDELNSQLTFIKLRKIVQDTADTMVNQNAQVAIDYIKSNIKYLDCDYGISAVDLISQSKIRLDEFVQKCNTKDYFISTGFKELDSIIGGWDSKEEYALVAARTNVGKSWILEYFAYTAAKLGKTVGLYSGEMTANKVGYRVDTLHSHISNFCLSHGEQGVLEQYVDHIKKLQTDIPGKLYVITPKDLGGLATVENIRSFCEKFNIQMLCIDQYSLMKDVANARQSFERFANISTDLKNLQTQLQIPILMACQLNREKTEGGPNSTNIGGSDKAGQDATSIYFLESTQTGIKITVGKHRDAKVGSVLNYTWDIDKGKFVYVPVDGDATGSAVQNNEQSTREFYSDKSDVIF